MSVGKPFVGTAGYNREVLSEGAGGSRKPASFVCDETGENRGAELACIKSLSISEVSLDAFPGGSGARGTIIITLPSNDVIFPRITGDDSSRRFYDYLRSVNNRANKETQYFANFHIDEQFIILDEMDICHIDSEIFWISPDEPFNWGMWLLQVLPAIYLAESRNIDSRMLCVQENGWQADFIRFFAPSVSEKIIKQDLDKHYVSGRGLNTICRSERNMFLTDFDRSIFRDVAAVKGGTKSSSWGEKIFVSRKTRSKANPHYRSLINEDDLISALELQGFTIVEPEQHSFSDQIDMFRDAKVVVGLGGAGMFNSVFCNEGTFIITIENSTNWVEAHANLFSSAGLDYGIYFGTPVFEDVGIHKRWNVRTSNFMKELRKFV